MMQKIYILIVFLFATAKIFGQSPHGDKLTINCDQCHNSNGWEFDSSLNLFSHEKTNFELEGIHEVVDCKACHTSLIFNEAPNQCISCHIDIHSMSVGNDCVRCHNSNSWLVDNIPELHESNGFPLTGGHATLHCLDCHSSESELRFDNIGNECISCHQDEYLSAQHPNHSELGFSTDCLECHDPLGIGWTSSSIGDHAFFPLTMGHDNLDCLECHISDNFALADPACVSCHLEDFNATTDPDHNASGFPTDCVSCHTTAPGWTPAIINHDFFPLTQGHGNLDCTECHFTENYSDADPACVSCHQEEFNSTTDPDHSSSGFSTDCAICHTTAPGWTPATINHDFFPLTMGHDNLECMQCHLTDDYSDADPACVSCHQTDFNNTDDPDHNAAQFPTDCVECHTTAPGWTPATFDHDNQYFPIYDGEHEGEWDACVDCHISTADYSIFSCTTCHSQSSTDEDHIDEDVDGYVYESNACFECHPDGSE